GKASVLLVLRTASANVSVEVERDHVHLIPGEFTRFVSQPFGKRGIGQNPRNIFGSLVHPLNPPTGEKDDRANRILISGGLANELLEPICFRDNLPDWIGIHLEAVFISESSLVHVLVS